MKYYICVTPFFPSPKCWQGAYVLDQVKAIKRNSDYEVIVFKTNPLNQKEEDYDIDGIHVYTIRPLLMPSYILNGLTENIVGKLFVRKLKQFGVDINNVAYVHCHTSNHSAFGFGVKRVNQSTKVLIQFHDLDPYCLRNGKWANKRWNIRYRAKKSLKAFNRADLLISISEPVQENLLAFPKVRPLEVYQSYLDRLESVKDFPSVQPKHLYILNNGVDISLFNPSNREKHYNLFRIGCIANFQELKNHITLIKAFEILHNKGYNDIILSFIGQGETKQDCIKYLEEHNLAHYVEWKSECRHEQLADYYRSLDLFVLPSIFEGFGCVFTEAAVCGVPFMGVYGQGAMECIDNKERNKWFIQPHDYRKLAELIENQYKKREIQNLVKQIDINILVKGFISFIQSELRDE